ncbi:element excision factor XisH family protein [Myxacorys almedinensis]|uniref:element excision factor XisH family protein n=1 Tax=Myxacorys almedinensis TaxID=2651157 RepID=UPI003082FE83
MSAKDVFHDAVKRALQKERWVITDDPLRFKVGNVNVQSALHLRQAIAIAGA